ncbi:MULTISPECIES: BTAD domain-containing putative transcriptional regulator [unclassified Nocardia]|uniref:AfsR/SARP family transcriptional regulator n=1 Tax=unclassified Nocardia TaxID=2637762 RepID=UPI0024A888DB|nr:MULTISPECIES: BTAD domain-containing putative transcriptional regulator [unclassified Nocardia]
MFSILGPIDLRVEGKSINLGPAKQRAILAALLIDLDRPVPLDVLVERVWGDRPPVDVRNLIYTYIARLRRKLATAGDDELTPSLKRVAGGYCLQARPEQVDLYLFRKLLHQARQPEHSEAERSALMARANALWRGVPLSGIGGRWAAAMRHSLQQLRHEALVEWADLEVRLGRPRAVIDPLRQAYVENPLSESVVAHLMIALYTDGRSAEALQLFEQIRQHLSAEIGADPGMQLRAAHRDILQGRTIGPHADGPASTGQPAPPDATATATTFRSANLLTIDLPDFVGREQHLGRLRAALTPGDGPLLPSVSVLYGPAGFGKTTIAIRAAYQLRPSFPSGQLFVDLAGTSSTPLAPATVLERFLRALGVSRPEIPDDFDERADMYRALLANSRTLVVLDNAADASQVSPLLPGTGNCGVIVTCRRRPSVPTGVPVIRVGAMSPEESATMLRRLVGARLDREPEAAAELLEFCGGSPLLLRIVGGRLIMRQHWTVSRLLSRLRDDDRLFGELSDGEHDAGARIAETFDAMDHETRSFYLKLANLPDRPMDIPTVATSLRLSEDETELRLELLSDIHLVDTVPGADRYVVPRLNRLYARTMSPRPEVVRLPRGVIGL